jgi:hypothetical protein
MEARGHLQTVEIQLFSVSARHQEQTKRNRNPGSHGYLGFQERRGDASTPVHADSLYGGTRVR